MKHGLELNSDWNLKLVARHKAATGSAEQFQTQCSRLAQLLHPIAPEASRCSETISFTTSNTKHKKQVKEGGKHSWTSDKRWETKGQLAIHSYKVTRWLLSSGMCLSSSGLFLLHSAGLPFTLSYVFYPLLCPGPQSHTSMKLANKPYFCCRTCHGPLASDFHSDHCNLLLLLLVVARETVQPVPVSVVLSQFAGDVPDEARNVAALAFSLCDSRTMRL